MKLYTLNESEVKEHKYGTIIKSKTAFKITS